MSSQLHICSNCQGEFNSTAEYVAHVCDTTGFTPANQENLGEEFKAVSEAAQERGAERQSEEAKSEDEQPEEPAPDTPAEE